MDNIAIESFIQHCDDMMIAEEGAKELLAKAKTMLLTLIKKVAAFIQKLLGKAKGQEAAKLKQSQREVETIKKTVTSTNVTSEQIKKFTEEMQRQQEEVEKAYQSMCKTKDAALGKIKDRHDELNRVLKESMDEINGNVSRMNENKSKIDNILKQLNN